MRGTVLLAALLGALMLSGVSVGQPPGELPPYGEEWTEEAYDLAQQAGMFGPLSLEDGQVRGAFVQAQLDMTTGSLTDYRMVAGVVQFPVFAQVEVEALPGACGQVENGPASLAMDCPAISLRIHNDPTRALIYQARTDTVALTVTGAAGAFIPQDGSVLVGGPGFNGQITLLPPAAGPAGSLQVSGGVLEVLLPADGKLVFRAEPLEDEGPAGPWAQDAVFNSLAQRRLGGEVFLVALAGGVMADAIPYGDLSFAAELVHQDRLDLHLTAPDDDGALVAVNLHKDVLMVPDLANLRVELDGEPVVRTDNADALATTDSADPLYFVVEGPNGLFLLVHVPHFSSRTLSLQKTVTEVVRQVTSETLLLVGLGAAVTALAAAALFRRGRREW